MKAKIEASTSECNTIEGVRQQDISEKLQTERGFSKSLVDALRKLEGKPRERVAETLYRSVIGRDDTMMMLQMGVRGADPKEVIERLYKLALELNPNVRKSFRRKF